MYGTSLTYMRRRLRYWQSEYERGSGPHFLPLVLTHGWPGSFVEFEALVEPLAHPERSGGRIEDAFDVAA